MIHRGYIYYTAIYYETTEEGAIQEQDKYVYRLYRQSLNNVSQKPEVIEEIYELDGRFGKLLGYGNSIFYHVQYYKDDTYTESIDCVTVYDIQKKTSKRLVDNSTMVFTIFNDKFIYRSMDKDNGIYMCDFSGDNIQEVTNKGGVCVANKNYLIIDDIVKDNRQVVIMDNDFNIVETIPLDESYSMPIGCSDDYYFVGKKGGENEYGTIYSICAIPLDSSIADSSPRLFYEFVPETPFNGVSTTIE